MRPALHRAAFLAMALPLAAGCGEDPAGLNVTVKLGTLAPMVKTLKVTISASPGGFQMPTMPPSQGGVTLALATAADGSPALAVTFSGGFPFTEELRFRIATGNRTALTIDAAALGFDDMKLVAGGEDAGKTLPAGGTGSVVLALSARSSPIGPDTRVTDLAREPADLTINGPDADAALGALAVCDVDGDMIDDVVVGAPGAVQRDTVGAVGAVYVIFGGGTTTTFDLSTPTTGEFHFFGRDSGDNLGSAVACADLNNDGADDLVAGAHRVGNGLGRVYVVFGTAALRTTRTVDLGSSTPGAGADVVFTTSVPNAELGKVLFAGNLDANDNAEILAAATGVQAAPASQKVHLLRVTSPNPTPIDVDAVANPVTFSGVPAAAIAAGDLDGSGPPVEVVLGDPTYKKPNMGTTDGAVYVFRNAAPTVATAFAAASADKIIVGNPDARLGAALVIAETVGPGPDLLIGAPNAEGGAGAVYLFQNDGGFYDPPRPDSFSPNRTIAALDPGGQFGSALGSARSGLASTQLVVGAPDVARGTRASVGAAYMFQGLPGRSFRMVEQLYGASAGDHLGTAVGGGQIGANDMRADLAATAPQASGTGARSGVAYVRYRR